MMKRKILAVILPIIGCATVVGSGFSAWYFGENINTGSNGQSIVNVNVTEEVEASQGNLLVDSSDSVLGALILDQGGPKNSNPDSGIMFGAAGATETIVNENAKWDFTVTFNGDQNLTLDKIYDAGLRVRVVAEISLGGNLSDYVEFKDGLTLTVSPDSDGATVSMKKNEEDETKLQGEYIVTDANAGAVKSAEWNFVMTAKTTKIGENYSNELLKYKPSYEKEVDTEDGSKVKKPAGKPDATGEPEKMEKDLADSNANITFNVTAYIEEDTTK